MIGDINNFVLHSQELSGSTTTFTFEFDKPSGDVGGYRLFMSLDGTTYSEVKFRVDFTHYRTSEASTTDYTSESGIKVYFEYSTTSAITDGRILYFKLRAVSEFNELSDYSSVLTPYTAPSKPNNLLVKYDGYAATLSWDLLLTSSGINSAFTNYNVYRKNIIEISNSSLDTDNTITDDLLEIGKAVWVIDNAQRTQWFGEVTTEGQFTISDSNKITLASDTSEEYVIPKNGMRVLIEDNSSVVLLDQPITNTYTDSGFTVNTYYIYSVSAETTTSKESEEVKFPKFTQDFEEAFPYLRSPGNSDNTILQQTYWKTLKNVLIDANYYKKTKFSIPYFTNEIYNLKGYLGISNCKLDIFINGIYYTTTSTGDYGEFDANYQFKRGDTLISFQARDKYNVKFSRQSNDYTITTLNMYAWFAAIGAEYEEIDTEIDYIKSDVNIATARYGSFIDMYAPLVELYKIGDESNTIFQNIISEAFKSFEYGAYDESLEKVLTSFKDNLSSLEDYHIYYNEDLFGTQRTRYTFTLSTSSGLTRGNYYYGVTACTSTGAETSVAALHVDRRWWPPGYYGMNVLMWDYVENADFYKIYRGSTGTVLYALTSTGYNFFVDINGHAPKPALEPRNYNYTSLEIPQNLFLYDRYGTDQLLLRLKKPNNLIIILYESGSLELEDYNIDRLLLLFEKLIPPEIGYRVIVANDTRVKTYPGGILVDVSGPSYDFAHYDESYYYHSSITNEVYA